jgi:DnaK suppressor protein
MPRAAKTASKKAAPAKKAAAAKATTKATTKAAAPTKKAVAKSAAKKGAPLDKFLEGQRKLLLEERETYTRQATTLRAEAEQLAAEREPGDVQFDEESGEGDTMNVERERDLALSAQALAAVDEIDRALAKIDAGTYGVCEKCGEPIPKERLKALPYAALCVKCKSMGLSRR